MSNTARTPWPQRPNLKTSRGRAAHRMFRLKQMEQEMLIEEREGLQMTEEQRQTLLSSFALVKTEFCDLDGLLWSTSLSKDIKAIEEVSGLSPRIPAEITNSPAINSPRSANSSFAFSSTRALVAIPGEGFPNPNCYGNRPLPVSSTPSSAESTVTIKACPSFPRPYTDTGPACSLPNPPVGLHSSSADDTCASHFSPSTDYTAGTPLTRSPANGRALSHLGQPQHAGPHPSAISNQSSAMSKVVQSLVLDLPCPQYCGESEATRDSLQPDLGGSQEDIFHSMSVSPHLNLNDSSTFSGLEDSPRIKTRRRIQHSSSLDAALSLLPNTPSNSPFLDTYPLVKPVELEERTSEDLRIELGFVLMSKSMLRLHTAGFANEANRHTKDAPDSSKRPPNATNCPTVDSAVPWEENSLPNHIREWAANVVPSVDAWILQ
ncbi:hypothetical protein FIBSPDRAFT_1049473 [Athelia psychrophila]|uniref:Uncharacterized protein n=1 Tax=Athelia psychrophila TaxID=1759441 RepID=A0A166C6Y0_9AGAM|nr:hypothetical protein FIBSPDRAFT_1049473 [Fibularhizoctonia sp. CBS 109695]